MQLYADKPSAQEHLLRGGTTTTGLVCSCGKNFAIADEARQHVEWHLRLAADKPHQHASDGKQYPTDPPRYKCKTCGQYYSADKPHEHHFVHRAINKGEWVKEVIFCEHCGVKPDKPQTDNKYAEVMQQLAAYGRWTNDKALHNCAGAIVELFQTDTKTPADESNGALTNDNSMAHAPQPAVAGGDEVDFVIDQLISDVTDVIRGNGKPGSVTKAKQAIRTRFIGVDEVKTKYIRRDIVATALGGNNHAIQEARRELGMDGENNHV